LKLAPLRDSSLLRFWLRMRAASFGTWAAGSALAGGFHLGFLIRSQDALDLLLRVRTDRHRLVAILLARQRLLVERFHLLALGLAELLDLRFLIVGQI